MNFGTTAKSILASVAPVLGTALGGPFGGFAGGLLSKALGSTDPKVLETAITSTDPEVLLKLKQADFDFQAKLAELGIDQTKLQLDDLANARAREIALRDKTPMVLAGGATLGFFGLLSLMCFHDLPTDSAPVINTMIGALGTAWLSIVGYYFGSSSGSAAKSATLSVIAEKQK